MTSIDRTSIGLIAVEEACLPEGAAPLWDKVHGAKYPGGQEAVLRDIAGGTRIEEMDRYGIAQAVLAITVPGAQYATDRATADEMAVVGNDALAEEMAKAPGRFIGFAALSMHDPDTAAAELERAVTQLGFRGALLYGFQRHGDDGGVWFYDDPRYDVLWSAFEELGVPMYLHPGLMLNDRATRLKDLEGFPWLYDAAWGFAVNTGTHALRIITSGVFDRHPKAQLILGHNGEHIVVDLWRISNRIQRQPMGNALERTVRDYFRTNVQVSTSGQFSTPALRHVIEEIGADRVLFAVDYPYETNQAAAEWFRGLDEAVSDEDWLAIARGNTVRLLGL